MPPTNVKRIPSNGRYVRVISCGEFRDVLAKPDGMDQNIALVAYALCDENGKRVYDTIEACADNLAVTDFATVFNAAQELNFLDAVEAKKNSNGQVRNSSGSGSRRTSKSGSGK